MLVAFDPSREAEELRAYLGERYDHSALQQYQRTLDDEWASCGDEQAFYRSSHGYLYNLTAFAMTGTKLPYLRELTERVPPGSRVLDYGCGIGSDGLMLLEAGYRVEFADFDNPSTAYLRWRLERRGLGAPVHDLDDHVPGGFDAAFAFDVLEHVGDPWAFLREMEERAALVEVNVLEHHAHEQGLHHEVRVRDVLLHAAARRLEHYSVLHGTSHLVLYRPRRSSGPARLRNLAMITAERLRRRLR